MFAQFSKRRDASLTEPPKRQEDKRTRCWMRHHSINNGWFSNGELGPQHPTHNARHNNDRKPDSGNVEYTARNNCCKEWNQKLYVGKRMVNTMRNENVTTWKKMRGAHSTLFVIDEDVLVFRQRTTLLRGNLENRTESEAQTAFGGGCSGTSSTRLCKSSREVTDRGQNGATTNRITTGTAWSGQTKPMQQSSTTSTATCKVVHRY